MLERSSLTGFATVLDGKNKHLLTLCHFSQEMVVSSVVAQVGLFCLVNWMGNICYAFKKAKI